MNQNVKIFSIQTFLSQQNVMLNDISETKSSSTFFALCFSSRSFPEGIDPYLRWSSRDPVLRPFLAPDPDPDPPNLLLYPELYETVREINTGCLFKKSKDNF